MDVPSPACPEPIPQGRSFVNALQRPKSTGIQINTMSITLVKTTYLSLSVNPNPRTSVPPRDPTTTVPRGDGSQ